MNRTMMSGLVLVMLTGGAMAQAATARPPATPPRPAGLQLPPAPPPGGPDAMSPGAPPPPVGSQPGVRPPPPDGPDAMSDDGPGGPPPPGGPRGRRAPPPPPPKSARFHIERGDMAMDIKCAEDEPMKDCADFTLRLLDRLQSMPAQASQGSATQVGPTPPAPDAPKP